MNQTFFASKKYLLIRRILLIILVLVLIAFVPLFVLSITNKIGKEGFLATIILMAMLALFSLTYIVLDLVRIIQTKKKNELYRK